jgi:hypothetical protein
MTLIELMVPVTGLIGGLSGLVAGSRHGLGAAVVGALGGMVIGVLAWVATVGLVGAVVFGVVRVRGEGTAAPDAPEDGPRRGGVLANVHEQIVGMAITSGFLLYLVGIGMLASRLIDRLTRFW